MMFGYYAKGGPVAMSARAGLGMAVVSAVTFGSSGALGASLLRAGWSPGAAVAVRLAIAALVLTAPALLQLRGRLGQLRRGGWPVVGYGLTAVAGVQLCYFNAVAHVSVGVALLLEYSAAVLVVAWLWVRHGQRPRRLTVGGGLLVLGGLVLVLDLLGDQQVDPVGVLWGLAAAVGLSSYFLLSARAEERLPPLVMAWGGLSVGTLTLLGAGALGLLQLRAPRVQVTLVDASMSWVVPVLGLSLLAAVVAYVSGVVAARTLGPRLASFVGLTEVLFAVGFAWLLLGQVPVAVQFVGGGLVLGGIALVRLDELRGPRKPLEPLEPLEPLHRAVEDLPLGPTACRPTPRPSGSSESPWAPAGRSTAGPAVTGSPRGSPGPPAPGRSFAAARRGVGRRRRAGRGRGARSSPGEPSGG